MLQTLSWHKHSLRILFSQHTIAMPKFMNFVYARVAVWVWWVPIESDYK